MPNISFASGGDTDTLDYVAYVAKDKRGVRSCFVLECKGGVAQEVITTIGQAFELRQVRKFQKHFATTKQTRLSRLRRSAILWYCRNNGPLLATPVGLAPKGSLPVALIRKKG